MTQQTLLDKNLFIVEDSRSHSHTPHLLELLWTSDRPDSETSTWEPGILVREREITMPLGVIRTCNPIKLSTADPSLRQYEHWNRLHKKNVSCSLSWAIRIQYIYFNIFYFSFLNINVVSKAGIYHIHYLTHYLSKEHDVRAFSFLHAYYISNPSHFYLITSLFKKICISDVWLTVHRKSVWIRKTN
jgi:hypothetical protein